MLNDFITFITGDPIMLGLSGAIVFLVFIFILILIFGGKKKTKAIEDKVEDNTGALLKSDLEPLKSTQEFTLNINAEGKKTNNTETPNIAAPIMPEIKEASISTEEVIPIPVTLEDELPVVKSDGVIPLETSSNVVAENLELPSLNETQNETKAEETNDSLDDIELPMLNKFEETSVLNSLEGEHYNV